MAIAALPVTNGGSIPDGHSFICQWGCWNFLGAESGGCGTEKEQVWGLEALTSKRQKEPLRGKRSGFFPWPLATCIRKGPFWPEVTEMVSHL